MGAQAMSKPVTTQLPHAFKRIRLELARSKEFPSGSATRGYELVAPLDANDHIDPTFWRTYRDNYRVRRFWGGVETLGHVIHKPGGSEHARWVLDYSGQAEYDDESGVRFGAHAFRPGEYVSITDAADETHTFRVAAVTAL